MAVGGRLAPGELGTPPAAARPIPLPRPRVGEAARPARGWVVALLCPILVCSAQSLAYIIDFQPTYLLSKAWPFLALPLTLAAIIRRQLPATILVAGLWLYAVVVTPVISMADFGAGVVPAYITTVKMFGFLSYFSTFEALMLLGTSVEELRRAVLGLGVGTFVVMWVLWLLVPAVWYQAVPTDTLLFFFDLERGPRIYFPMFFGFILMFHIARGFWIRPRLWRMLALAGALATLLTIYKQKLAIASLLAVILLGGVAAFPRYRRLVWSVVLAAGAVGLLVAASLDPERIIQQLGGSLETRMISFGYALDFLREAPLRWVLGAGALPQKGAVENLGDLFRFSMFFLSDLGWVGIVFEYGLVGTALVAAAYVTATRLVRAMARPGDPWSLALFDYTLYLWMVLTVYSAVGAPGEIMTVLAMAVYTRTLRQRAVA